MLRSFQTAVLPLFAVALIAGCGREESSSEVIAAADTPVGSVARYDWYMQGTTPAGQTTITKNGDGRITNESFVHWNNREWTVNSELQLDENGRIASQKISGISPFKSVIDEYFTYENGVASWGTPGENGSVETDKPAFYLADEGLSFGAAGAMVKAAVSNIDNSIDLFPNGRARVEKVRDVAVDTPDGEQTVSLYAVHGIGFTPNYLWFDKNLDVVSFDGDGYLGMIPEGWDVSVLKELSAVQSEVDGEFITELASDLATPAQDRLVFENIDVVDVVNGVLIEDQNVLVGAGKIIAVSAAAIDDANAMRIDGNGLSLMPGLWDMHAHFSLSDGVLNIAGGITNVRNIGGVHEKTIELTAKHDSGEVIGPNTFRAGFMDKAGPYASGWAAESLQQALERVDFYAEHGYIQIKLYSSIEPDWVAPIAERAHSHGMRVSGHIPAFMSAEQAVRAGYDEIQHINMVFLNFLAGDREDTRQQIRFTLYGDEAGNLDLESDEVQDFFALLKDNNVAIDPTAAIFDTSLRHLAGSPDPTFAAVIDNLPPSVARSRYNVQMNKRGEEEAWLRSAENQAAMLKALHDYGIQIIPGSDDMAAFTVHREIELYAEAGIPVADVLRIATLDSARITGVADRKGSIEVGKDSDLILVDGNPLQDVSAIRRAVLVMKGDTLYRPEELYSSIGIKPFVPSIEL
ncbi:MAG: amidohydrolase family protein [Gammaproteobacteria bacterium]|nr:amidohydrolase family protein [Gammaproteobacteria bacterium]